MAQFLSGAEVAEAVLADVAERAAQLADRGITPGLGTILVGDDGPSASYVRKKHETCEQVGVKSFHIGIDAAADPAELTKAVLEFNNNPEVDGFIIQHPTPEGFDFNAALMQMNPDKDGDGLHPVNLGRLVLQQPGPRPATPAGILQMLDHYNIDLAGKHVVVVGRGPTLGRPMALMLANKGVDAAVTVVHSRVSDIASFTKQADVIVSAVGRQNTIKPEMVKDGAVVVSGGISWEGKKLLPDVDELVAEKASWITPRLGGVGPTTVAMLLRNTIEAAEASA